MMELDLPKLCENTCQIVRQTGHFLKREMGNVTRSQVEEKSLNSLVSYVDKTAEAMLVKQLNTLLPAAVFLTEEETVIQQTGQLRWIIDPLDGTTNFLHHLPCFAVSVALEVEGAIELGIVYEVNHDECFYSWKRGGSYMNGEKINVTKTTSLSESLISTGFPYQDFSRVNEYFKAFNFFMKNTRGIRRFGSAAVDLAYVACGRYDAFFEYGLNAWDVAAGILLVQEAGGNVTDFSGGNNYLFGKEMVAVNSQLTNTILKTTKEAFYK